MRRLISIQAICSVVFALLVGPFLHLHAEGEDHDHHHASGAQLHAHLFEEATSSNSSEVESPAPGHHRGTEIAIFSVVRAQTLLWIAPVAVGAELIESLPITGSVAPTEARSHDPPGVWSSSPRSPPA